MSTVLIIWEDVPEETKFYKIDAEKIKLKKILKAHGQFQNTPTEGEEVDFVDNLLHTEDGKDKVPQIKYAAIDLKKQSIDYIIHCGLVL